MKQSRILKVFVILLLLGCLIPTVAAKKKEKTYTIQGAAKGYLIVEGSDTHIPIKVKLLAKVSKVSNSDDEWVLSGPAKLAYITPNQKILVDAANFMVAVGDEGILGFKVEINGQFLSIDPLPSSYTGKADWMTNGVPLTINGNTVKVYLVWKFCINAGLEASLIVQE